MSLWDSISDWFSDVGSSFFGNPSQAWDRFKNGRANELNAEIARENLDYQKERNAIEDARYQEETAYNRAFSEDERAYNRAFAEDERAYNRALQDKLFEREDTAYLRQAEQLSKLGINPAAQQLNGANAGQVVDNASAPASMSSPTLSTRGGKSLHNGFNAIPGGIEGALSFLSDIASTVNGVATGQYQRDSLALQNDAQFIQNLKDAHSLGIKNYTVGSITRGTKSNKYDEAMSSDENYNDSLGSYYIKGASDNREYNSKKKNNIFDWESNQTKLIKSLGTLDFQNIAENLLTNVANAGSWVNNNLKNFNKDMENNSIINFIKKFFAF